MTFDPYRALFPMGVAFTLAGAAVWPLAAFGTMPYPGSLHAALMIQGFEQCFVLGFLLTAMPAFTQGPKCHPLELAGAIGAMTLFGVAALFGLTPLAHAAFLASLAVLWTAGIRRVARGTKRPPEEFLFVGFGLLLGTLGGVLLLAVALGVNVGVWMYSAQRLLSLGMILSLIVGVGSLLVPAFAGIRDPMAIPSLAGAHERPGRRALYLAAIALLALAFVAESLRLGPLGAFLRALAVSVMGLWVWKLTRLPRRDVPGFVLWSAGWMVMAGLWVVALFPPKSMAGLHLVFIGGFALLTMGIATRVVVSHGRYPLAYERRTLDAWIVAGVAASIAFRLLAEFAPGRVTHYLAAGGLCWIATWLLWTARMFAPLVRPQTRPAEVVSVTAPR